MTRRFLSVSLVAWLASCGGSDGDTSPLLAGFSPADQGVLVVPATPCTAPAPALTFTGLLFGFSSFTGLCGFAQDTALCGDVASSTVVTVSVLRGRDASPDPAPIGPGTYPISLTGLPTLELDGSRILALADVTKTAAACAEPAVYPDVTAGTLILTSVTATAVAGSVDVSFSDGSRFLRSFDLPVCNYVPNVCSILDDSCTAPTCCPTTTTCP